MGNAATGAVIDGKSEELLGKRAGRKCRRSGYFWTGSSPRDTSLSSMLTAAGTSLAITQARRLSSRLHDKPVEWRIALDPELAIGEAFMDGRLTLEQGAALRSS